MRSFNFCLNFVCLSFSPRLVPCLSTLSCWPCLRCSFPAASSIHQVQAADLRRVSAPPGSLTMWVQCHSVLTLFPQLLLLLRARSPEASFSSTGLLLREGGPPNHRCFHNPLFFFLNVKWSRRVLCALYVPALCICAFILLWNTLGPGVVWVSVTVYAKHRYFSKCDRTVGP